jgi:hypothetical protein
MPAAIALTTTGQIEIVSAYSTRQEEITAFDSGTTPDPWIVIGGFVVSLDVPSAKIQAIGLVTAAGLILRVRVFDVTARAPVAGMLTSISGTAEIRAEGTAGVLLAGHQYQFQAACTKVGAPAEDEFAILRSCQLVP